jgi:sugar lactone lactonase YvrE
MDALSSVGYNETVQNQSLGQWREQIMRLSKSYQAFAPLAFASTFAIALATGGAARAADAVVVPGSTDFPESITSSADGTLYFSSFGNGRVWRAKPGEATASEFIKSGSNGLASALGVLADDKSNTLFVCSDDFSGAGIKIPGATGTSLKLFDLKTGEAKGSIPTPGQATLCNDIVVASDGTAYVADSFAAHILRLKPGAKEFEVWAEDARWNVPGKPQLDGIAILGDGAIYSNLFEGDGLYRVPVNSDGSPGKVTKLQTSRPLYHSDGLRAFGPNKLIMVEGETKGNLDLITIDGDNAKVETIKDGFDGPVGLTQVGDQIYVLDVPLRYLLGQEAKDKKPPPPFKATPVPAPKS